MLVVSSPVPQELQAASDQADLYLLTGHTAQVDPERYLPGAHLQSLLASWPVEPLVVLPPGQLLHEVLVAHPLRYLLAGHLVHEVPLM